MVLEVAGLLAVLLHVAMVVVLLVWFGLGMPKSRKDFWLRFKNEFLSLKPHPQKPRTVARPVRYVVPPTSTNLRPNGGTK